MRVARLSAAALVLLTAPLAACSSSKETAKDDTIVTLPAEITTAPATATTLAATTTTAAPKTLHVLVSDDDGVKADGIDAIVEALRALPDTEVTVIAPFDNQSGAGGKTTPGTLEAVDTTTKSGFKAVGVKGFPADSVNYALDKVFTASKPELVVSGVNQGQNLGPLVDQSGTVGAARAAAQRGIPAIAASQALTNPMDYRVGVEQVIAYVTAHRAEFLDGRAAAASPLLVVNINAPTCASGARGVVEVPTATDFAGRSIGAVDCASTATNPKDDVDAFITGFVSRSLIAAKPAG